MSTLIFMHIPKAAGSTLLSILVRQYKRNSVLPIYGTESLRGIDATEKIKEYPEEQRMRIRVLVGHMKFGLHDYLKQPTTYITFLREPVRRIISHYHYAQRTPEHYLYNTIKTEKMDLAEYVSSSISDEMNNGQTRFIAGLGDSVPFGECSPDLLHTAEKNISEHFSVVGLSERFDESLFIMKDVLGWKVPYYKRKNVSREDAFRQSIPKEILDIIMKYNELDVQLYENAERRFEEMIAVQPPSFKKQLHRFERLNKYYGWLYFLYKMTNPEKKVLSIDLD